MTYRHLYHPLRRFFANHRVIFVKFFYLISAFLLIAFSGLALSSAAEAGNAETLSANSWNGTWINENYTFSITQNESGIAGVYIPVDIPNLDPGRLEGNLSADGKTYSGIWIETGSNTYTLSNDNLSFTITGHADPVGPMTEPVSYASNATRIGDFFDDKNPWTGNFATSKKSYNLIQNGTTVTGVNEPLTNVNDETGVLKGTLSEDGRSYNGTWIEKGGFTFVLADDGSSINATITKSLEPNAIVEQMIFSQ